MKVGRRLGGRALGGGVGAERLDERPAGVGHEGREHGPVGGDGALRVPGRARGVEDGGVVVGVDLDLGHRCPGHEHVVEVVAAGGQRALVAHDDRPDAEARRAGRRRARRARGRGTRRGRPSRAGRTRSPGRSTTRSATPPRPRWRRWRRRPRSTPGSCACRWRPGRRAARRSARRAGWRWRRSGPRPRGRCGARPRRPGTARRGAGAWCRTAARSDGGRRREHPLGAAEHLGLGDLERPAGAGHGRHGLVVGHRHGWPPSGSNGRAQVPHRPGPAQMLPDGSRAHPAWRTVTTDSTRSRSSAPWSRTMTRTRCSRPRRPSTSAEATTGPTRPGLR